MKNTISLIINRLEKPRLENSGNSGKCTVAKASTEVKAFLTGSGVASYHPVRCDHVERFKVFRTGEGGKWAMKMRRLIKPYMTNTTANGPLTPFPLVQIVFERPFYSLTHTLPTSPSWNFVADREVTISSLLKFQIAKILNVGD
jgi:hypothetical protein